MRLRKATKSEYSGIKKLYAAAFPRNERAPFFIVWRRAAQGRAMLLVAEEESEFVGFVYTVSHKDLLYLFYFAVVEDKRGKGKGSEILRLLKTVFVGKKILLAMEPIDEHAPNSRERRRRRSFYVHNGFVDLPFQIKEANVMYDAMATCKGIDPMDYNALIKSWAGRVLLLLVQMRAVA